mgnify:CR=1 FL=1
MDLLDINVWLALTLPRHTLHPAARDYWHDQRGESIAFNRITMLGFTRLLMNKAVTPPNGLSSHDSWEKFEAWLACPDIYWMDEPVKLDSILKGIAHMNAETRHTWTDAYLAAFAISGGLRLVSFDGGFSRFPGLSFLHLAG